MKGHFKSPKATADLIPYTGGHRSGKSNAPRILNRQNERRLLKQSQELKPSKPTKGFK